MQNLICTDSQGSYGPGIPGISLKKKLMLNNPERFLNNILQIPGINLNLIMARYKMVFL
jgi:hypothetical protein